jgi:radical SAM superfamily enzyme YgiQ (UPF0313 family)
VNPETGFNMNPIEKTLLHHFVLLLRRIASRGNGAADAYRLWKNDAPVKLAWIQPGVYDPQRRKLIHRLTRGRPMLGGIKVNSLAYLATLTPDWVAQTMVDDNLTELNIDDLTARGINLAAISSMTQFAPRAYQIARELRTRGVTTILGGPHATLCPEEAMQHVDSVVAGEAEEIWEGILEDFRAGRLKRLYRSHRYVSPENFRPPDERVLPYRPFGVVSVQSTRGCPHNCKFCCVTTLYGHQLRKRPIASVLNQVKGIRERGLNVFFTDDNIIGDREYAKELFRGLTNLQEKAGKPLLWGAQSTLLFAFDQELLQLASQSGCRSLYIGFETLSREALAQANKRHNLPERYREAIETLRRHSIRVWASLMLGLPGEDKISAETMFRLLLDSDVLLIYYYIFTPLPGTALREELDRETRLLNKDRWDLHDTLHANFVPVGAPDGWTVSELQQTIWRFYDTFYRYRYIARRLRRNFLSELKPAEGRGISPLRAFRITAGDMYFSLVSRLLVGHRLHPFETP